MRLERDGLHGYFRAIPIFAGTFLEKVNDFFLEFVSPVILRSSNLISRPAGGVRPLERQPAD
jgi:hypothetical protein